MRRWGWRAGRRLSRLRRLAKMLRYPSVGAMMAWYDLAPSLVFVAAGLRHPGGLIKPFLRAGAERAANGTQR